jgi:heme exporter protein C
MWWKITSVVLILYSILAGFLVPLKSGIVHVDPAYSAGDTTRTFEIYGYNTLFTQSSDSPIRAWLSFDESYALAANSTKAINDTILQAEFKLPAHLPEDMQSARLNMIVDHPTAGTSILPAGVEMRSDTGAFQGVEPAWSAHPVNALHVQKGFSFPYQNVIYETIRNTYYHVPMWFVLLFLFTASVYYSARFLRSAKPDDDRKASAYAEAGLLFGVLGLFTGMVWANYTWGKPWSNDIKQLMTAVALLIYLAYFILRSSFDEPEKSARLSAVYNIFAFASLIPLLYIVPRMFASLHPGATGNPAFGAQDLDNTMRAVFYPAIIGWTLLGFWLANLRIRQQRLQDRSAGLD